MRKVSLILIFFISIGVAAPAANTVSGAKVVTTNSLPQKPVNNEESKKILNSEVSNSKESPQVILKKINAFSLVEKSEKNPTKLIIIKKSKSGLWLALAKAIRANQKGTKITAEEINALNWAIAEATGLLKLSKLKKDHSYSYYIQAMAQVDFNKNDLAVELFQKSIEAEPRAEWIPTVALFLGEHYFEKENFEKAVEYYTNYQAAMNPLQKSLASYKTAWCFISRKKWDQAIQMLDLVIAKGGSGEFTKDSLRDLSFVMVQGSDERAIIAKAQELVQRKLDPDILFLSSAYSFLQRESKLKGNEVFKVLLEMQKNPVKRIELRLNVLRTWKTDAMSLNYLQSFQLLQKEIVAQWKNWVKIQESVGKELETEFEVVIALLAKANAEKTKVDPTLKGVDLISIYKMILKSHLDFFPKSQIRPQLIEALLDFCQTKDDFDCIGHTAALILKDPTLEKLHERAFLIQIDRISLATEKDSTQKAKYRDALEQFTKRFMKSTKKLDVSKRLLGLYINEKLWSEALALSITIFKEERTPQNFFQVQWIRFNFGKYLDVLNEPEQPFENSDKKFISIRREATLKLASEAKIENDSDFAKYEQYIKSFLKLSDDQAKKKKAILHYAETSTSRKKYSELLNTYLNLTPDLQLDTDVISWIKKILVETFLVSNLDLWNELFRPKQDLSSARYLKKYLDEYILYLLINHDVKVKTIWRDLSAEKQKSFLSLLLMSDQKLWIELAGLPKSLSKNDKAMMYLAIQFLQKTTEPQLNNDDKKILQEVLPENIKVYDEVALEKKLKQHLKKQGKKTKSLKVIQGLIAATQKFRTEIIKSLKVEPPAVRVRVLNLAIQSEKNMVQLILESDIPKELDTAQVAEYKQGLETLTEEFKNQAVDFEKAEQKISEMLKQSSLPGKKLPEPLLDKWNVIKEFKTEAFQKTYSATGFIFGMILLDMKKGRKEIDEIQYAWSRSWLILKQNNPALSRYHYDELTTQNQKEILTTWELSNAPQ